MLLIYRVSQQHALAVRGQCYVAPFQGSGVSAGLDKNRWSSAAKISNNNAREVLLIDIILLEKVFTHGTLWLGRILHAPQHL